MISQGLELNKIYNMDCVEGMKLLPDNCIDLILTDPPYELSNHGGGQNEWKDRKLVKDKHIDFMSNGFLYDDVFNEFMRICKIPNFLIFCSNQQVSKVMRYFEDKNLSVTLLAWNKTNPPPFCNGKYLSDLEFVVCVKGKGATFNNNTPFEYKHKIFSSGVVSKKNRLHPAQKPTELIARYMLLHSKERDVILDCFMGSGTTAVVAKKLNRDYIGFEISKEYCEIAEQRIAEMKGGAE